MNIVFAAPDDLDGFAQLLGKNGRFRHLVGLGLASEAAAEQGDVARHVFFLNAEHAGNCLLHSLRILRGRPGENFSVAVLGYSYWRLHGSVRQMRSVVLGLDDLSAVFCSLGKRGIHIADVANDFARLGGKLLRAFCETAAEL